MITIQKTTVLPIQEWRVYKAILVKAAQSTLAAIPSRTEGDITLVLSNDAQIRALNQRYRGIDAPTDVLSFTIDETNIRSRRRYIGDVVISLERAKEQAATANHSISAELALLTVHGILHLCGYDHEQPANKDQMWDMQKAILTSLGVEVSFPSG